MPHLQPIPCASSILYNSDNEVLLQQRDNKPNLPFAGYWTLFGGQIEKDESPEDAIKRELIEEIALKPHLTYWKNYKRIHNSTIIIDQHIFIGEITERSQDITLYEGQAHGFFSQTNLKTLAIAFEFDQLLEDFFVNYKKRT